MRFYQNKNAENYKKLEHLSLVAFLSNLPNFIIILVSALLSGTTVVWVDTLVSLGETSHAGIVWLVAHKMRKETGDKYNFGMSRLEVFISFICDLIVSVGMLAVLVGTVLTFNEPVSIGSSLALFCVLKFSNSIYDLVFFIKQTKICRARPSKLNETEKATYRDSLINDLAVGIIVLICYLFRDYAFVQYFNPIVSILLALYFLWGYVRHIRRSVTELSDASLPLRTQDAIYDVILEHLEPVKHIRSVNCRRLNGKAHVEVSLELLETMTYPEMHRYLTGIREEIRKIEPDAEVLLVIGSEEDE